jgi:hypothetical protein
VKEQSVESVRNAEGVSEAGGGKPGSKWTSRAQVAKGTGTREEALEVFGSPAGDKQLRTLKERPSNREDEPDFSLKAGAGIEGRPPSRWKQGAHGGSK